MSGYWLSQRVTALLSLSKASRSSFFTAAEPQSRYSPTTCKHKQGPHQPLACPGVTTDPCAVPPESPTAAAVRECRAGQPHRANHQHTWHGTPHRTQRGWAAGRNCGAVLGRDAPVFTTVNVLSEQCFIDITQVINWNCLIFCSYAESGKKYRLNIYLLSHSTYSDHHYFFLA